MVEITENKPVRPKETKSSSNQLGNWSIWLGVVVSFVAAFINLPYGFLILVLLGLIGGYLIIPDKDAHQFVVFSLGLWLGITALDSVIDKSTKLSLLVMIGRNMVVLFASGALLVSIKTFARLSGVLK